MVPHSKAFGNLQRLSSLSTLTTFTEVRTESEERAFDTSISTHNSRLFGCFDSKLRGMTALIVTAYFTESGLSCGIIGNLLGFTTT